MDAQRQTAVGCSDLLDVFLTSFIKILWLAADATSRAALSSSAMPRLLPI